MFMQTRYTRVRRCREICAGPVYRGLAPFWRLRKTGIPAPGVQRVNLCLLDMSKVFDKVNYYGLYIKLMIGNLPPIFLRILINYSKCCGNVRWDNVLSRCFSMVCGVCQGMVLSPVRFMLMNIIERLNYSKLDCFIGDLYLGCIMYADDLILISTSVSILQQMIFRRNAMHCISSYAIVMCVCVYLCVCLCVCMPRLWIPEKRCNPLDAK